LKHTKGFSMREVRTLVLDEADRMLSMDFEEEINTILSVIPREGRNTMLFSATMTSKVQKLQRASLRPGDMTVRVQVSEKYGVVKNLDQKFLFVPAIARDKYLVWLLHEFSGKSAIVFTATCSHARRLAHIFKYLDLGGGIALHGQMSQPARLAALAKFKGQAGRVLIATDVAARGLDIPSVDLVVNYDVPQSAKDYIHRVGRTARAGRAGKAVTVVSQYDVEAFQKIEQHLGEKLEPIKVDKSIIESLEETVAEAGRRANADMREEEKSDQTQKKRRKYRA
jgi:ATP-dependent RNA helicase DDX47/RRP3